MMWVVALMSGIGSGLLFGRLTTRKIRLIPAVMVLIALSLVYIEFAHSSRVNVVVFVVFTLIAYLADMYSAWSNHPSIESNNAVAKTWEIFRNLSRLRSNSSLI